MVENFIKECLLFKTENDDNKIIGVFIYFNTFLLIVQILFLLWLKKSV